MVAKCASLAVAAEPHDYPNTLIDKSNGLVLLLAPYLLKC